MRKLIYKLLLYLTYLLALALISSYISVYISPQKIWWFAFIGLAFPYLLLANLLSTLFWFLTHKKRIVLIPIITILAGWSFIGKVIQIPIGKSAPVDSSSIKILTYNVRAFNIYKWAKGDSTGQNILTLIKKETPEIICLQEFFTDKKSDFTFTKIEAFFSSTIYSYYYGKYSSGDRRSMGLAIFSSFPILNSGVIPFENTHNASIYCDLLVNTDTLRVYNNHLQSIKLGLNNYAFIDTIKLRYNDEQIKEIKDISIRLRDAFLIRAQQADHIKEHILLSPYPVVVCGDFNDPPISYTYFTIKNGLRDAFIESGRGIGNTYIGKAPSFRIDYILHSEDIQSDHFERIKAQLSDHYPLTCRLNLKK